MSIRRALSRLVAAAPAFGAAVLVAAALGTWVLVTTAAPAQAARACCNPDLSGLPGSVTTGTPVEITVSIRNRSRTSYSELRRVLVIRLGRLEPGQVTVERSADGQWTPLTVEGDTGTARATDPGPDNLRSGTTQVARYRLTFAAGAPTGKASLIAEAYGQRGGDWTLIGRSGAAGTTVREGASPSASPTESESDLPTPVASAPEQPTAANSGIRTDSGGLSLAPFAIAGVLLILLGGLGGWWLIRRNNTAAEQEQPLTLGPAARHAAPHEATQVVRYGSDVPPGPAVYTSGQRQPADATRVLPTVPDRSVDATQRIDLPADPPPVDPFDHTRPFDPPA